MRAHWMRLVLPIVLALGCLGLAGCGSSAASVSASAAPASSSSSTTTAASPAVPVDGSTAGRLPGVQHPPAGNFKPNGATVASCAPRDAACLEQAFGNLAYKSGPETAFALVSKMLNDSASVQSDCHTIMHTIGSATLARFHGDSASAMGHGSMLCGSGYYHGLIEFALLGTKTEHQLVQKVVGMCSDAKALNTTFLLYQCIHGLGHGVMIFSGDDLPWALGMCSKLATNWLVSSCGSGVFMQNFALPSKLSPFLSRFVRKNDLLYPCDWVSPKFKYYCYLQITEHILAVTGYDWQKTAATCDKAPGTWPGICFQSYGRDASGASRYDPNLAYKYCLDVGRYLGDCVYGVARDFTNNFVGGTQAAGFCGVVRLDLRGSCFYAIGTILHTFGHTDAWLAQTCTALSRTYAKECTGALTSRERAQITFSPV